MKANYPPKHQGKTKKCMACTVLEEEEGEKDEKG